MPRQLVNRKTYKGGLIYENSDIRGSSLRDIFKPQAIQANNKTFFTWIDRRGFIMIDYYDHNKGKNINPTEVAPRSDYSPSDIEHAVPAITIDDDGYIYVFYGPHNTQLYFKKSGNPYDISSWGARTAVTGATTATYPFPFMLPDNTLCVVHRQGSGSTKSTYLKKSIDGGTTWGTSVHIVQPTTGNWSYVYGLAVGDETPMPSVHIVLNPRPDNADPTDPFGPSYYLKSVDGGTTWTKADGTEYTLPVSEASLEQIVLAESYPGEIKLNSSNEPYVCYQENISKTVKFTRWNGSAWTASTTVCTVASYQFETVEMDIVSDSVIDIYTIAGTVTDFQGGNLQRYRSTDTGANWSLAENITTDASGKLRYYYPKVVKDYLSDFKVLYMRGIPTPSYNAKQFEFRSYP